jgi:hypothetical protein
LSLSWILTKHLSEEINSMKNDFLTYILEKTTECGL